MSEAGNHPANDIEGWRRRIRNDTQAHYHLEMGLAILERNEDAACAVAHLRRALTFDPDCILAHYLLIKGLLGIGRDAEAAEAERAARSVRSDHQAIGACLLAARLIRVGRLDEAARTLDFASPSAPAAEVRACRDLLSFAKGGIPASAEGWRSLDGDVINALQDTALDLAARQPALPENEQLFALLAWCHRLHPGRNEVAHQFALLLRYAKRDDEAIEAIARSEAAGADDPRLWLVRSQILSARPGGRWKDIAVECERVLNWQPSLFAARYLRWQALTGSGRAAEVIADIEADVSTENTLQRKFALISAHHVRGDLKTALNLYRSIDVKELFDDVRMLGALQLLYTGEPEAALAAFHDFRSNPRSQIIAEYALIRSGFDITQPLDVIEAKARSLRWNVLELLAVALMRFMAGSQADETLRSAVAADEKRVWMSARILSGDYPILEGHLARMGFTASQNWPA